MPLQWADIAKRNLLCPSCWANLAVACVGTHTHTHSHVYSYSFIHIHLVKCGFFFVFFLGVFGLMPRAFNVVYRLSCHLSSIAFALFCLLSASTVPLCLFCFVLPIFSHLLRAASSSSKYLTFIMGYPSQAGGQVKSAI